MPSLSARHWRHPVPPLADGRPDRWTVEAARRWSEDGYLEIADLCDEEEVGTIRSTLLGLFEREAGRAEGNLVDLLGPDHPRLHPTQPQLLKPSLYAPGLLLTRYFQAAQGLATTLIGEGTEFSFDHSILRRPGPHAATPWHQDEAHHHDPHFRREQVSIWLALQDVDEENGCLRYLPGSHRGALLPHRALGGDPRIHALEVPAAYVRETQARSVPLKAGSSVLHGGLTLHASRTNVSKDIRLAYVLVFQGPPVARTAALHFHWLKAQRTASASRHRHWLWHGGAAVLAYRWWRRLLKADRATLLRRLRRRLRRRP